MIANSKGQERELQAKRDDYRPVAELEALAAVFVVQVLLQLVYPLDGAPAAPVGQGALRNLA